MQKQELGEKKDLVIIVVGGFIQLIIDKLGNIDVFLII